MTKREEAIEALARAICRRTCPHIGGPDCETLVTGKPNWVFHRFEAEAAFDAVVKVLMEPSEEMIAAADEVAGTINPIDAYTLALKAAAQ